MRLKRSFHALWLIVVLLTNFCSCVGDTRYFTSASIDPEGWVATDTITLTINPLNNVDKCGLSLFLYTDKYEYENIAFDILVKQGSKQLYHERRSYLLKSNISEHGIGHRYEYILPVDNVVLCDTLSTIVTLTQQLDQPILKGIYRVGVCFGSPLRLPGEPVWQVKW